MLGEARPCYDPTSAHPVVSRSVLQVFSYLVTRVRASQEVGTRRLNANKSVNKGYFASPITVSRLSASGCRFDLEIIYPSI
ncbi:hypothetical protein L1987_21978 [Smallanthus sonchifolius]|uniref:Uncharacterized protein n=1 Tax=Smallanthus sonchifolius TaxID=185202 RepID=A0ACB9IF22_9ASTR|nr:hypothetical protein L1987_21978 [Smallanthus sonchifolius]